MPHAMSKEHISDHLDEDAIRAIWARSAIIAAPRELYAYQINPAGLLDGIGESDNIYKAIRNMMECDPLHARVAVVMPPGHVLAGYHQRLPCDRVIIEISGESCDALQEACALTNEHGYATAIQTGAYTGPDTRTRPVYIWCDAGEASRVSGDLLERAGRSGSRLLARNVKTSEDADLAITNGFDLIQGPCFDVPRDQVGRTPSVILSTVLGLMAELSKRDTDHDAVVRVVSRDPALTFRLLRYVNSSAVGMRHQINSVRRAALMLGEVEFRRWCFACALGDLCRGKPTELVRRAVVRGKFAELASAHLGIAELSDEAGTIGILSTIDALLDRPMEEVLASLHVSLPMREVLLGNRVVPLARPLLVTELCESGAWSSFSRCCAEAGVRQREILLAYYAALSQTASLQRAI